MSDNNISTTGQNDGTASPVTIDPSQGTPSSQASAGLQTPNVAIRPSMFSSSSKTKRRRLNFGTAAATIQTSYSSGANENSTNKAWIIKILPKTDNLKLPFSGYTVTASVRYADDFTTKILYSSKTDKGKTEFLEATCCVPRVIDTVDEKGNRIEYVGTDGNIYHWKGLAFVTDDEDIITDENIQNHVNNVVTPAVLRAYDNTDNGQLFKYKISEKKLPHLGNMNNSAVRTVDLWSEAISSHHHIVFIINQALQKYSEETGQDAIKFKDWCKLDKNHIYTIFNKGNIPADFIKNNRLAAECMDPADWSAYLTSQKTTK